MYYTTYKTNERRVSAIERLVAIVEQEIITNKKKAKKVKEDRKNETEIRA